jgi:hypothetical protein
MKHFAILFALCALTFTSIHAQNSYPKGVYYSFDEILKSIPRDTSTVLLVERRSVGDIKMNGGNDYKLIAPNDELKSKAIKRDVSAYSTGDTLYINGGKQMVQKWYCKVISDGAYIVFMGGLSNYTEKQKAQMDAGAAFGAIGGAVSGAKAAMLRFPYAINRSTKELIYLEPIKMKEILGVNPELLAKYEKEEDNGRTEVILKYMEMVNAGKVLE